MGAGPGEIVRRFRAGIAEEGGAVARGQVAGTMGRRPGTKTRQRARGQGSGTRPGQAPGQGPGIGPCVRNPPYSFLSIESRVRKLHYINICIFASL